VRGLNNLAMTKFGDLQLKLLERIKSGELTTKEAVFKVEEYWVGSLRNAAVDGEVVEGSLMAGQSVGAVTKVQPLREILQDLVDEADDGVARVEKMLG